ncbi:hypothetical protein WME97_34985 [Sorangium sp. So ce367]|uniref:hypothetical protein n=1 Tax=Sorangium sp. So ce367 TaxID=3133305 RepID=UPI003F63E3E0
MTAVVTGHSDGDWPAHRVEGFSAVAATWIRDTVDNHAPVPIHKGTTFSPETDGVWQLVDYDHDGIPDLTFIKTSNTATGRVEVFVASGASGYQTRVLSTPTSFRPEADGAWQLVNYDQDGTFDLAFVKTSNTGSGTVEVHLSGTVSQAQPDGCSQDVAQGRICGGEPSRTVGSAGISRGRDDGSHPFGGHRPNPGPAAGHRVRRARAYQSLRSAPLVASLAETLTRAVALGDEAAARVIHEAIGRLLGLAPAPKRRASSRRQWPAASGRPVSTPPGTRMPGSPCSRAGDTGARCAPPEDGQLFAAEPLTHNDGGSGCPRPRGSRGAHLAGFALDSKGALGRANRAKREKCREFERADDGSALLPAAAGHSGPATGHSIGACGPAADWSDEGALTATRAPRTKILAYLGEGLRLAIAAGDGEGARVAHEAIGRLLGAPAPQARDG